MNDLQNRRILLIDDMPSIHEDFQKIFASAAAASDLDEDEAALFGTTASVSKVDFELDSAFQGQEGLTKIEHSLQAQRPYAMAFVDMRMPPGWDGVETIERLWQSDPRLQVVICTAYSEHSWESVLERLDARDRLLVLKKPFDAIEVYQLARTLVMKWDLRLQAESQMNNLEAAVQERTRELSEEVVIRRQVESTLRVRDRAIEAAINAIVITDFTKPGNPIEYVNPAFRRITGYDPDEVIGRNPDFLQGKDRDQPACQALGEAVRNVREGHGVMRNYRKDGTLFWNDIYIAPVRDSKGDTTHFIGILNDVTASREHERSLEFQANHDALTGLPNRSMLQDRIGQAIAYARRVSGRLAVLYFDLDHFKPINDNFGHKVGDELLIAMSARVKTIIREEDTLARLGGDEFVLLMPSITRETDAAVVAQKLLHALSQPFALAGQQLHVGASVGVSIFPEDGDSSEEMLLHADTAMYRAKTTGRNGFCFYSQEMSKQTQDRATLGSALRRALDEQQFELYYQPKVNIANSQIVGVEALIRWHHPDLGIILPLDFIPIAEENGLIAPLGEWILKTACAQVSAWQMAGLPQITMAVNISARQFRQQPLPALMRHILAETGVNGQQLELELVESLLVQNSATIIDSLREIKTLGVSLSLDDFGTGFSSLSYLKRFLIDSVKIDRSVIANMVTDASLTKAIVAMAHALDLQVVAEGVETQAQLDLLLVHRCDAAQGYLFSQPLPATEIEKLLRNTASVSPTKGLL